MELEGNHRLRVTDLALELSLFLAFALLEFPLILSPARSKLVCLKIQSYSLDSFSPLVLSYNCYYDQQKREGRNSISISVGYTK